jgi:hypothetical protein
MKSEILETDWTVCRNTGAVPRNTAMRSPKHLSSWNSMLMFLGMDTFLLGSLD